MGKVCYLCRGKSSQHISLHKFPKNPIARKKWMKACDLSSSDNLAYIYICSKHFNAKDIVDRSEFQSRASLISGAVPSIGVPNLICSNIERLNFEHNYAKSAAETTNTHENGAPNVNVIDNTMIQLDDVLENIRIQELQVLAQAFDATPIEQCEEFIEQTGLMITADATLECGEDANLRQTPIKQEQSEDFIEQSQLIIADATLECGVDANFRQSPIEQCEDFIEKSELIIMDVALEYKEDANLRQSPIKQEQSEDFIEQSQLIIADATLECGVDANLRQPPIKQEQSEDFIEQSQLITADATLECGVDANLRQLDESCDIMPKRKYFDPRYVSEIRISDFSTLRSTKRVLNLIKDTDTKKAKLIKSLQDRNRNLERRISSLEQIIADLENEKMMTDENGDALLSVANKSSTIHVKKLKQGFRKSTRINKKMKCKCNNVT